MSDFATEPLRHVYDELVLIESDVIETRNEAIKTLDHVRDLLDLIRPQVISDEAQL